MQDRRRGDGSANLAILTGVADQAAARSIAQRMLDTIAPAIAQPNVTASIGVSLFPDDATEPSNLLRQADAAMYRVKAKGKNAVAFYATS